MNQLALHSSPSLPALITTAGDRARFRFLEFFTANIRNPNTRRAYARAALDFLDWCRDRQVTALQHIHPIHVAGWIEELGQSLSAPTVKQRLAALRHLFDWMVTGQVIATNTAHSVRGPSHIVKLCSRRCRPPSHRRRPSSGLRPPSPLAKALREKGKARESFYGSN